MIKAFHQPKSHLLKSSLIALGVSEISGGILLTPFNTHLQSTFSALEKFSDLLTLENLIIQ